MHETVDDILFVVKPQQIPKFSKCRHMKVWFLRMATYEMAAEGCLFPASITGQRRANVVNRFLVTIVFQLSFSSFHLFILNYLKFTII